jgi:hypothetical protein
MAKKQIAKKVAPKKVAVVKLDHNKMYQFTVSKDTKHLKKGVITISGEMAEIFIAKGLGTCLD